MSATLTKLFENGQILQAIWDTLYMTGLSTLVSYLLGLPLGVLLFLTQNKGLTPCKPVNLILGFIVNLIRSIPFIILTFAVFPLSKAIAGTSLGNGAMIVTLVIGATPYIARMVESSLLEVDAPIDSDASITPLSTSSKEDSTILAM